MASGGIDRDLELAIERSEGERSAFGLDVALRAKADDEEELNVVRAQGACLLGLPDHDPYAFDAVGRVVRSLPLTASAETLLMAVAGHFRVETLDEQALSFRCRCSLERASSTLLLLGEADLMSLAADPGYAEITCHYCGHSYRLEKDALKLLVTTSLESKGVDPA